MKKPQFLKQKNMLRVLYALVPVALTGIYFFGWRVLVIAAISGIACFITEWIMAVKRKGKISYACFVTAAIFALSLPPTTPFWIVVVGAVVAILFAKEAFGGFGKNVFNPAGVGRAFVYVCFPVELTSRFVPAFREFPGGLLHWSFPSLATVPEYLRNAGLQLMDGISAATPMLARKNFSVDTDPWQLFTGAIHGTFHFNGFPQALAAGSAGETAALVIILSGIYLIYTKTANWRLMVSPLLGALALNIVFKYLFTVPPVPDIGFSLLSGALLYVSVFMVTDPVSAPRLAPAQYIYGFMIGALIVLFRYKSVFVGGAGFALLLGNMCAPTLDLWLKKLQPAQKKAQPA